LRSHAHGVDHCGTSWSVHNNQLKKPSSFVRSQHEVPVRIFIDLLDHESVSKGVLNVLARDPVTEGRWQFIHLSIVLRNLPWRPLPAAPGRRTGTGAPRFGSWQSRSGVKATTTSPM